LGLVSTSAFAGDGLLLLVGRVIRGRSPQAGIKGTLGGWHTGEEQRSRSLRGWNGPRKALAQIGLACVRRSCVP
jgi:hypothetical protein